MSESRTLIPSVRARLSTRVRLALAIGPVLLLAAGSTLRSYGLFRHDIYWLQEDLGGDKAVHFLAGIVLMASGWLLALPRTRSALFALLLCIVALLSLEECVQLTTKTREFDLFDLIAGYAGAGLLAAGLATVTYPSGAPPGPRGTPSKAVGPP